MMCKINKSEIPGEPFFHALFGRCTSFYGHFLVNVGMSEGSTCISSSEIFQGNRGQKNHPCFCGINVMILWKKSLETSFVVFRSFLTKNLAWVTLYQAMYKMFHSWFPLHIFVEKEPFTQFYGRFDHFYFMMRKDPFKLVISLDLGPL